MIDEIKARWSKVDEPWTAEGKEIKFLLSEVERLQHRLEAAEAVCKATTLYLKHIDSPVCIGWDDMIDALCEWQKVRGE